MNPSTVAASPTVPPAPPLQPSGTVADLGKGVKAKYPGQYDDVDDASLGQAFQSKYPGQYDDFSPVPSPTTSSSGQSVADTPRQPTPHEIAAGSSVGKHVAAFVDGVATSPILHPIDAAHAIYSMVRHPEDTVNQAYQGHENLVNQATNSYNNHMYTDAAVHGALSMIPILGPALDQHYQEIKDAENRGDTVGMVRGAGKMLGLGVAPEIARRAPEVLSAAPEAIENGYNAAADAAANTAASISRGAGTASAVLKGAAKGAKQGIKEAAGKFDKTTDLYLPAGLGALVAGPAGWKAGLGVGAAGVGARFAGSALKGAIESGKQALTDYEAEGNAPWLTPSEEAVSPGSPLDRLGPGGQVPPTPPDTTSVNVTTGEPLSYPGPRQLTAPVTGPAPVQPPARVTPSRALPPASQIQVGPISGQNIENPPSVLQESGPSTPSQPAPIPSRRLPPSRQLGSATQIQMGPISPRDIENPPKTTAQMLGQAVRQKAAASAPPEAPISSAPAAPQSQSPQQPSAAAQSPVVVPQGSSIAPYPARYATHNSPMNAYRVDQNVANKALKEGISSPDQLTVDKVNSWRKALNPKSTPLKADDPRTAQRLSDLWETVEEQKMKAPDGSTTPISNPVSTGLSSPAARMLDAVRSLEPIKGVPVSTLRLRAALPDLSKEQFDQAAMELGRQQKAYLSQHVDTNNITPEERDMLIKGTGQRNGEYYVGVGER